MFKRVASAVGSKHLTLLRSTKDGRFYHVATQQASFKSTLPSLSLKKTLGVESKLEKEADEVSSATIAEELDDIQLDASAQDLDTDILTEIYSGELFEVYNRMPLLVKREKKQGDVPYTEEPSLAPTFSDEFSMNEEEGGADSADSNTLFDAMEKVQQTKAEEESTYEEEEEEDDSEDINPTQLAMEEMADLIESEELTFTEEEVASLQKVGEELEQFDVSDLEGHSRIVDRMVNILQKAPKSVMESKDNESEAEMASSIKSVGQLVSQMDPLLQGLLTTMEGDFNPVEDKKYQDEISSIDALAKYLTSVALQNNESSEDLGKLTKLFGFDYSALQKEIKEGKVVPKPSILSESSTSSDEAVSSSEEEEVRGGSLELPFVSEYSEVKETHDLHGNILPEETLSEMVSIEKPEEIVEEEEGDIPRFSDDEEYYEDEDEIKEKEEKEIKERYNTPNLSLIAQFNTQMGDAQKIEGVVDEERGKQRPDATVKFPNFRNKPRFNDRDSIPSYIHSQDIEISKYCNAFDVAQQFGIKFEDSTLPDLSELTQQEKSDFIERQLEYNQMPFQSVQAQRKEIKERQAKEKGEDYKSEMDELKEYLNDEVMKEVDFDEKEFLELDAEVQAQLEDENQDVFEADSFVDTVIVKQDNPYEPFMLATHPHLFVDGSANFVPTDTGKMFIITPEKHKKYFGITGTGGDLDKTFESILQRALLVREPVLPIIKDIHNLAKNKKKITTDPGYLFMGIQGSGKSACLATCVYNAYTNGVLVVHIPSAHHWTHGIHFVEPSPVLQGYYDAPLPTRDFLKSFMTANDEILKRMPLSKAYSLPLESGQKLPTTLYELCDYALLMESNISVVFKFVLDELINDTTTPMLFAIDDYNFLHDYTFYQYGNLDDFATTVPQKIHAKNYTLVRALNRIISQNAPNKLVITANTNKNKTPNKVYMVEDNVLDPVYVPSRYTFEELSTIVEYYQSSAFVFGNKENYMEDLLFMSGGVPQRVYKHMSVF